MNRRLVLVLLVSLVIDVILSFMFKGYLYDQLLFIKWAKETSQVGIASVYSQDATINYPPVLVFLLSLYWKSSILLHFKITAGTLSFKAFGIILYVLLFFLLMVVTARIKMENRFLLLTLYALNPAILFEMGVWGQLDLIHSTLMVLSVILLFATPFWGALLFAISLMMKFQAITLLPVLFAYVLRVSLNARRMRIAMRCSLGFFVGIAAVSLMFILHHSFYTMIDRAYLSAVGLYPKPSVAAPNVWLLFELFSGVISDNTVLFWGINAKIIGLSLVVLASAYSLFYILRHSRITTELVLKVALFENFSFFLLATEMHERYIFPSILFLIFIVAYDATWRKYLIALTISGTVSMIISLVGGSTLAAIIDIALSIINLYCYYRIIKDLHKSLQRSRGSKVQAQVQVRVPDADVMDARDI